MGFVVMLILLCVLPDILGLIGGVLLGVDDTRRRGWERRQAEARAMQAKAARMRAGGES